ncbi:hypothetical protein D9613_005348 [Agrocybe pediades]|uniref:Uncharacterized protein n=1 Tax=Agrocybe pediades TaxID=84607 RepID=A0A8H4VRR4_9AGAR|nr:hypothetical protein D9613_005348 [Agrocybe pediades]
MLFPWQRLSVLPRDIHLNISRNIVHSLATMAYVSSTNLASHGADIEIVEDSEPERAEIRQRQRTVAPPHRSLPLSSHKERNSRPLTIDSSIIEISSDSSSEDIPVRKIANPVDDSDVEIISDEWSQKDGRRSLEPSSPPVHTNAPVASTSGTLNLSRFAFPGANTKRTTSYVASTALTGTSTQDGAHKPRPAPSSRPPLEFSDSDLNKITRCVSCDKGWTTRKSPTLKMSHIRTCAKKRGLQEETLRLLVKQQVTNYQSEPKKDEKGKQTEKSPEYTGAVKPNTFLEHVLGDAVPKKKSKRQRPKITLAGVSSTREAILARAQSILNSSTLHPPNVEGFNQDSPLDEGQTFFASTQPFGQSSLSSRQPSSPSSLFYYGYESCETRDAGPSIVSTEGDQSRLVREATSHQISSLSLNNSDSYSTSSSSSVLIPGFPNTKLPAITLAGASDAVPAAVIQTPSTVRRRRSRSASLSSLVEEVSALDLSPLSKSPKKTPQTKRQNKTPRKKRAVVFGDAWISHMQEHIFRDTQLYDRILRYEPIDLSVFWELAKLYDAPPNSKLKAALKVYLDDKAIIFYEAQTWGRRCR